MNFTTNLQGDMNTTIWVGNTTYDNVTLGPTGNASESNNDDPTNAFDMSSYHSISYIVLTIMRFFGLAGNILTIIVMRSPKFYKMTSRNILIVLAVSDSFLLLTQPFNKDYTMKLLKRDARALSEESCKLFFLIFRTSKMTSSWFVVYLCLERFVAVWQPMKAKTICTKLTVNIVIAFVCVFIGGFNAAWTFSSKIVKGVCHPDFTTQKTKDTYTIFLVIGSSIYSLIPICILCVLTPLIVVKLVIIDRQRRNIVVSNTLQFSTDIKKTSIMLLSIAIAYLILILPITLFHNIAFYSGMMAFGENGNIMKIFKNVSQTCEQINYSINFFLYVLTSSQFRNHLLKVICRCRHSVSEEEPRVNQNIRCNIGQNLSTISNRSQMTNPSGLKNPD